MPRRYHRPPTVKRRKARRTGSANPYEDAPSAEGAASTDISLDEFSDEEWDEGDAPEEAVPAVAVVETTAQRAAREAAHHIQRDYSYVRSELARIAMLAVILLVALLVVAVLR